MTLGIVLVCNNGVVVGSDRKEVQNKGVTVQRKTNKIFPMSLGSDCPLLCTTAGSSTVAGRMLSHIDPEGVDDSAESLTFSDFMTEVVEREIPTFAREYHAKHGDLPTATLAFGCVNDGRPVASTVYNDGQFDYEDRYTAIGSGSLIAEILLRDSYDEETDIKKGRRLVAYIIQRVSEVDSNVEGIDVRSINEEQEREEVDTAYLTALQSSSVENHPFTLNLDEHVQYLGEISESISEATADIDIEAENLPNSGPLQDEDDS